MEIKENKQFNAELEIVKFDEEDVITTSPCTTDAPYCSCDVFVPPPPPYEEPV